MERDPLLELRHSHNFLDDDHVSKEWRTWSVIALCSFSMVVEIVCGTLFGSLALVADGIHMSTHALAFFITASAYSYSRIHANNPKFVFGTGKVGELSSFTCAIILLAISCVIIYEGIDQFLHPVKLDFIPALIVSFLGLTVNILSALLLGMSCGEKGEDGSNIHLHHNHGHGHGHSHGHAGHEFQFLKDFDEDDEEEKYDEHNHQHHHGHEDHNHGSHHHSHEESFDIQVLFFSFPFGFFSCFYFSDKSRNSSIINI
jgi:hypothetical protein